MQIKIALAGNPNCGKTTLFNILTGSNQYVGNWPGVTVEKKEGFLKGQPDVVIQDLPGISQETIDTYKTIGCEYLAVPYLAGGQRPGDAGFDMVLSCINVFGALCCKNGLTLLYHNHDFEFVKLESGEYGLDYMYSNTQPQNLQTELDTCWVNIGGEVPAEYIRKYAGRCPVVHLKDFVGSKSENMYALIGTDAAKMEDSAKFEFRPVGSGKQDFPAILAAVVESGAKYVIVEQDNTYDIPCLEAAKMSREYLKTLGW